MKEIHISTRESQARRRRQARSRVIQSIRDGVMPTSDDMAIARGVVIRERENSIFSDAWIPVASIILIIGLIVNRSPTLLAIGITLLVVVALGSWWRRASLLGVTYERTFNRTHVFPGEAIQMTITVNNQKPLPLTWLQISDDVPAAPDEAGEIAILAGQIKGSYVLQNTLSVGGYERIRRSVTLRIPKRGFYELGPVTYKSGDIFTLFTVERQHRYLDTLVVYPRTWPLDALELPAKEMFGELNVRRSLFTDPIKTQGIRDYQPEDRFRDVHWKATAKRGDLQTKVYEPTSGMNVVLFLNVATYPKHWMGFDPVLMERVVSVAASIASYAAEQRWGIGLYANGSVPGSDQPIRVAPGHAPDQLVHILEALAAVTEFATGSIELLMHKESRRLPWSATFVLVTGITTEEMLVGLLRLKEAGRRVTLISLSDEAPPRDLKDVLVYHVPSDTPVFQREKLGNSATEASLSAIPGPKGSELAFDRVNATDEQ